MSDPTCVCCGRPMPDQAYACTGCTGKAAGQLDTIVDMTPAARDVAQGQARHGSTGGGSEEGRLPLNLAATQRLDAVQVQLTGWVRHVADERGQFAPGQGRRGSGPAAGDLIVRCALWLPAHLEWLRHQRYADEALGVIAACARIVAGIARGPAAQRFLGPCGAPRVWPGDFHAGDGVPIETPCDGDVYARDGARTGSCRSCGAEVSTSERRDWLDGEVRSHAFRAAHIADAYGLNVNTIRSWAARGRLRSYWRTEAGLTVPWDDAVEPNERARLHYVGDVLDLAAADAARRGTEQAKRARRAAAREAADVAQ